MLMQVISNREEKAVRVKGESESTEGNSSSWREGEDSIKLGNSLALIVNGMKQISFGFKRDGVE